MVFPLPVPPLIKILYFAVLIWMVPITSYLFPILARFTLATKSLFVNAFVLSFGNLPKTIFILMTTMFPIACVIISVEYVIKLLPLVIMVAPGLIAFLNATMFIKVFEPYMPKEETEDEIEEE